MSAAPVLFHRAGALGDLVLTLPVLAALFAEHERVDVAVPPRLLPLVRLVGTPGRTWDPAGAESLWMHGGRDPVGYAEAVCFSSTELPIARVRRVAPRPPPGVPAWRHFTSGVPCDPTWRLRPAPSREDRPIVLAPGASRAGKVWATWRAVHARLPGAIVVGGPQEPWAEHRPDLVGLARLAAGAGAWIGADSGPTHLAALCGAPVAAVFSSTDPAVWAPRGAAVFTADADPEAIAAFARAAVRRKSVKPKHDAASPG